MVDMNFVLVAAAGAFLTGDDRGYLSAISSRLGVVVVDHLRFRVTVVESVGDESTTHSPSGETTGSTEKHALLTAALLLLVLAISISITTPMTTVAIAAIAVRVAVSITIAVATTVAGLASVARRTAISRLATVTAAMLVPVPSRSGVAALVSGGLPLGAAGGLLEIVPALGVLVEEGLPTGRQRGLVRRWLVLRLGRSGMVLGRGRPALTLTGAVIAVRWGSGS